MTNTLDQASAGSEPEASPVVIAIPEGFEKISRTYLSKRHNELSGFQNLLDRSAYEEIRIMSHGWKGTGTPYGFAEITRLGAVIEAASKQQHLADVIRHVSALRSYVESAVLQLPPLP